MHRWFLLVVTGLAALAALTAVSAATPGERASTAAAGPVISSVSPKTLVSGQRTTIKGRRFVTGKRRNTVVFLGRRGKRDDVKVKATATTTRKIVVKAPRPKLTAASAGASAATQAVSGPLQVVNALGKSKASSTKVTFDQDKDGLSNEREIQLGTNPRKADTDGDGVRDGRDSDPLNRPAGGGSGTPGGGGAPQPIPTDCPASTAAGPGSGPASSFGQENVLSEARSLVSHTAVVGATKYCLYRKTATSAYRLVGTGPGPDAGVITDGGPASRDDYQFRTDALTPTGVLAGSNAAQARGAEFITNVTGWAGLNLTCSACGASSVASGSLNLTASGSGVPGEPVGSTAVYKEKLPFSFGSSGEWVARPFTPPTAVVGDTSASLSISAEHPALTRTATTVGDLKRSSQPFINVELRAVKADNSLRVIVTDSAGTVEYPGNLKDFVTDITGPISRTYLTVAPQADSKYEVRFKTNANDTDQMVLSGRAIPGGLARGWLSLRSEMDSRETTTREIRFDSFFDNGTDPTRLVEYFGDPPVLPPPPPPPPAGP